MSDNESSVKFIGDGRPGFGPYPKQISVSFAGDGTITSFSSTYSVPMGVHVKKIGTGEFVITVGPKHQVLIFAEQKEQDMTAWLKKQHKPEEEKKPNNILRNLFWLGVAAAILAAFML